MPMGSVPARYGELDPDAEVVVICHHGARSFQVAMFLEQQGFSRVFNLYGGVEAWSQQVDPAMPRY
jgi:rhodanese-related sulfurtransferase